MTTQRSRPADARAEPRERGGMLAVERPSPSLLDHRSGLHHTLGIAVEDQKAEFTHDAFHVGIAQREATPMGAPKGRPEPRCQQPLHKKWLARKFEGPELSTARRCVDDIFST